MKKVYKLFATALVLATGALGASARHWTYSFDTPITEETVEANKNYVLQAGFSAAEATYHFLAGSTFSHSSNLTLANIYTLENTGEKDSKGATIFYVKNQNLYLANPSNFQFYTDAQERAWKVVVRNAVNKDAQYSYDKPGKTATGQDTTFHYTGINAYLEEAKHLKENGGEIETDFTTLTFNAVAETESCIVIVSAEPKETDGLEYNFLLTYPDGSAFGGAPAKGTNYYRNVWKIYEAMEYGAKDGLKAIVKELTNDVDLVEKIKNYTVGEGAGEYSPAKHTELMTIWNRIKAILDGADATDEEMDELANKLIPAYDAFTSSGKPLQEGYYILYSLRPNKDLFPSGKHGQFPYGRNDKDYDDGAIYDGGTLNPADNKLYWSYAPDDAVKFDMAALKETGYTYETAKFVWHVTASGENDKNGNPLYHFKSVETDRYIGKSPALYQNIQMTKAPEVAYTIAASKEFPGYFNFYSPDLVIATETGAPSEAEYSGLHVASDANRVVAWDWRVGGSCWKVITLSESEVKQMLEALAQPKRNAALKKLIMDAEMSLDKGKAYMAVGADGQKIAHATTGEVLPVDGLVTQADQLSSLMQETSEGPIEGLLDGKLSTFFHSQWSGTAWKGNHFIQFKLEAPQDELMIKWVKRVVQNVNNGAPKKVVIWGTDKEEALEAGSEEVTEGETTTTNYDAWKTKWDSLTVAQFTYPNEVIDGENTRNNYAGTIHVKANKAYKYYRMAVVSNMGNGGNRWFHGSEMRVYKATYDKAGSLIESVPAEKVTALKAIIETAKKEVEKETATDATIKAFETTYEDFLKHYPDPSRVHKALREAKAVINAAQEGDELGYYTTGSKSIYEAAVNKVENDLNEILKTAQPNVEQVNSLLAALDAANVAFDASLKTPQDGIYIIRSNSSNETVVGRGLFATNSSREQHVKIAGRIKAENGVWGDDANFKNKLGAYWKVQKVESGYTYQNVFTGLYLSPLSNDKNKSVATQSETPYVFSIRFAKEPGCFNIIAKAEDVEGDNIYVNAQPGYGNLVFWHTANGRDNSAFKFEAADVPAEIFGDGGFIYDLQHENKPQIMTFPIQIDKAENPFYTVIGQDASNNIQLALAPEKLEAGQAYVYIPEAGSTDKVVTLFPTAKSVNELNPVHVEATPVNGLVPTFEEVKVAEKCGIFNPAHTQVLLSEKGEKVAPNTGYFSAMPETTETGATALSANGKITSINNAVLIGKSGSKAVYTISGVRLKSTKNLPAGLYIVNGKKQIVK